MNLDAVRGALRWTWVAVAIASLYTGYVMFSRWQSGKEAAEQARKEEVERNTPAVKLLGDGQPKVLMLYAKPPVLRKGDAGSLCYGVVNVTKVQIEPGVEPIRPSLSRCVEIKPSATTSYTLTASDDQGRTATEKVEVTVR